MTLPSLLTTSQVWALAVAALAVSVTANPFDHYWRRAWGGGVHFVDLFQEWAYYLLFLLTGVHAVFGAGIILASRSAFQGVVNLGTGSAFFDAAEPAWTRYEFRMPEPNLSGPGFLEWSRPIVFFTPKIFAGRWRALQLLLGVLVAAQYEAVTRLLISVFA